MQHNTSIIIMMIIFRRDSVNLYPSVAGRAPAGDVKMRSAGRLVRGSGWLGRTP